MALPKKQLREKLQNLTDENFEQTLQWILDGNTASVDAVKEQLLEANTKAEKADELENQLKQAMEQLEKAGDAVKVQAEFDAYKEAVEGEKTTQKKRTLMDALLKNDVGVQRESARRLIMDAMDFAAYELDGEQFKDAQNIVADLKAGYADFVTTTETTGVPPINPPSGGGKGMTSAEIAKIEDRDARRAAIQANPEAFGLNK